MSESYELSVNTEDLRREAVELLRTQSPDDTGRSIVEVFLDNGITAANFSNESFPTLNAAQGERLLMRLSSPLDTASTFIGFDSQWHNDDKNQHAVGYFEGGRLSRVALGTEVNYYFQGIVHRVYGYSWATTRLRVKGWKTVSRHGAVNADILFFLKKGYDDAGIVMQRAYAEHDKHQVKLAHYKKKKAQQDFDAAVDYVKGKANEWVGNE